MHEPEVALRDIERQVAETQTKIQAGALQEEAMQAGIRFLLQQTSVCNERGKMRLARFLDKLATDQPTKVNKDALFSGTAVLRKRRDS